MNIMPYDDDQPIEMADRINHLEHSLTSVRRDLERQNLIITRLEDALRVREAMISDIRHSLSFRVGWIITAPARFVYNLFEKRYYGSRLWLFIKFLHTALLNPASMQRHINRNNIATLRLAMTQESPIEIFHNLIRLISGQSRPSVDDISGSVASRGARVSQTPFSKETRTRHLAEKTDELRRFLSENQRIIFSETEQARLTILLVVYNRAELTLSCIRALRDRTNAALRLLIVNNASTDSTSELLSRLEGVEALVNDRNEGFLLAVNRAVKRIRTPYFLLLNNDAEIESGAIEAALETLDAEPDAGATGGRIVYLDGSLQEAGCMIWKNGNCMGYGYRDDPDKPEYRFKRAVDYCSGVFLMTRTDLFRRFGGFDLRYEPAYYEDADYCLTLQEHGYRVVYSPEAVVRHMEFGSADSPKEAIRLQARNRRIFFQKRAERLRRHLPADHRNALTGRLAAGGAREKILYLDDRIPHVYYGAGMPRANLLVRTLVAIGRAVTVYPLHFPDEEPDQKPHFDISEYVEIITGRGMRGFRAFMNERSGYYDRIIVCRPTNMAFFNACLSEIKKAVGHAEIFYDAEAIFALRTMRLMRLQNASDPESVVEAQFKSEMELARGASTVLAITEEEAGVFRDNGCKKVYTLGHGVEARPTPNLFEDRRGLLFVGHMEYDSSPNVDSLEWFIQQVWPLVQTRLPSIEFHLVGADGASRLAALQRPGAYFHGRVNDLTPLYNRARVFVCPTRYAAGLPLKVLEAAAHGAPVFATDLIIGQLGWEKGSDIEGASHEDPQTFAEGLAALYLDGNRWGRIRENALRRVENDHSPVAFADALKRIIPSDPRR